jgi:hypothetical protein
MPTTVTVYNDEMGAPQRTYQVTYYAGDNDCKNNKGYSRTVKVGGISGASKEIPVAEESVKSLTVVVIT